MAAQEFHSCEGIVNLKVHGLKAVALESRSFIMMETHRLGLPLHLKRKTDGKTEIPKWMIIYEFG